jgi:hypothetical protein
MNHWKKPALVNGVVIVVLLLIDLATTAPNSNSYTPRLFLSGTLILLLAPINLVIGMVRNRNKKQDGPFYLLVSGLMLLIGSSVCTL